MGVAAALQLTEPGVSTTAAWPVSDKASLLDRAIRGALVDQGLREDYAELLGGPQPDKVDPRVLRFLHAHVLRILEQSESSGYAELTPEELHQTVEVRRGNTPVILTTPHDGTMKHVGGHDLPKNSRAKGRDFATYNIAVDLLDAMAAVGLYPSFVHERVHRSRITPQIHAHFEGEALREACRLAALHGPDQPILHIDLHGFGSQFAPMPNASMVLGTNHGATTHGFGLEKEFASYMQPLGYDVYVPGAAYVPGEKLMADNPQALVMRFFALELSNLLSMQIEVARRFREKDARQEGRKLSNDIASFIGQWLTTHRG